MDRPPRTARGAAAWSVFLGALAVGALVLALWPAQPAGAQFDWEEWLEEVDPEPTIPPTTEPPVTTTTSEVPETTTTTEPTTTTSQSQSTTTTQASGGGGSATTSTTRPSSTSSTTSSSTSTTSTSTTTTIAAALQIAPPAGPPTEEVTAGGPGGWSTGSKLGLVVGGLLIVASVIGGLTVSYWLRTRPNAGGAEFAGPLDRSPSAQPSAIIGPVGSVGPAAAPPPPPRPSPTPPIIGPVGAPAGGFAQGRPLFASAPELYRPAEPMRIVTLEDLERGSGEVR